jgi:hypothetical protein
MLTTLPRQRLSANPLISKCTGTLPVAQHDALRVRFLLSSPSQEIMPDYINKKTAKRVVTLQLAAEDLVAVHGFLSLGLRHPSAENNPLADAAARFACDALDKIVESGVLTDDGLRSLIEKLGSQTPSVIARQ